MTDHLHPDPLHLAAALDYLGDSPPHVTTLSPATAERRRFMLEDPGGALAYFTNRLHHPKTPAVRAAGIFELAAAVWREYLLTFAGSFEPDTAALDLHAWATYSNGYSTEPLPLPLPARLAEQFPQVGKWAATVYVSGLLPLPDVGAAAAWHAVYTLGVMCTGPGFEDGEAEDLLNAVLSGLDTLPGRVRT